MTELKDRDNVMQSFHKVVGETVDFLKTDLNLGLKQSDVEDGLRQYGYNEIPEKKIHPITLFVKKVLEFNRLDA